MTLKLKKNKNSIIILFLVPQKDGFNVLKLNIYYARIVNCNFIQYICNLKI
jgi:hypothetical protein